MQRNGTARRPHRRPPGFRLPGPPLPAAIGRWILHAICVNERTGKRDWRHGQISALSKRRTTRTAAGGVDDPALSARIVYPGEHGKERMVDLTDPRELFVWLPEDFECATESPEDSGPEDTPGPVSRGKRPAAGMEMGVGSGAAAGAEGLVGERIQIYSAATGAWEGAEVVGFDGVRHALRLAGGQRVRLDLGKAGQWRL